MARQGAGRGAWLHAPPQMWPGKWGLTGLGTSVLFSPCIPAPKSFGLEKVFGEYNELRIPGGLRQGWIPNFDFFAWRSHGHHGFSPAQVLLEVGSSALSQKKSESSLQVLQVMSAEKSLCPFQVSLQKLYYHN